MATSQREVRLEELFAAGWTTDLFAEFWVAPDLKCVPSIISDDVVGYWPGDRTRIRDGLVCENYIFFDPIQFQTFVNGEVPSI